MSDYPKMQKSDLAAYFRVALKIIGWILLGFIVISPFFFSKFDIIKLFYGM